MAVAAALAQDEAAGIAAGGNAGALQFKHQVGGARGRAHVHDALRILHPDHPAVAVMARTGAHEITAEVYQQARVRFRGEQSRATVHGVFLAETAEVYLHAGGHCQHGPFPLHAAPANQWQQCRDDGFLRHAVAAIETPGAAQHARGDVEQPLAQSPAGVGVIEQGRGLVVHLDRRAVRVIDAVDDVAVAVAAELALDAQRLIGGQRAEAARQRFIRAINENLAGAGHRPEAGDPVSRGLLK